MSTTSKNLSQKVSFEDTRSLVSHTLPLITGDTLDLGAGTAKYKSIIQKRATTYIASDLMPGPHIDVVTDIIATPFENESFDSIYCLQVFEHIPQPWLAAKEIIRILRPGGICIVSAPFLQASHADPHDYFRYTVAGLESFFLTPECELIESGRYGKIYSILFDFVRMVFFNVYEKPKPFSWRFVQLGVKAGNMLDTFCSNDIIYMNSYVIFRKRKEA